MLQQLEQQQRKEGEVGGGDGHGRMAEANVVDLTLGYDQLHFNVST